MKLEFSAAIKAVPMADIRFSVDCSAEELAIALADPAYQDLVQALIAQIQQAQRPTERRQRDQANRSNDCHRNDRNGKVQDHLRHHRDCQAKQNEAIKKVISTINTRFDAMKRNDKPGWGELD